jgi:hypothetical protein
MSIDRYGTAGATWFGASDTAEYRIVASVQVRSSDIVMQKNSK